MSAVATPLAPRGPAATHAAPRSVDGLSTLTVDLGAVGDNVSVLRARAGVPLIAVVKADGFGHGAVAVARTALDRGASGLGVTSLQEAWDLRAAGITGPILSWLNPVDADWARAAREGVEVAVPSLAHLDAVAAAAARHRHRARVHLHVDVGMSRDGAAPEQWSRLAAAAARAHRRGLLDVVGLMGHLGRAAEPLGDGAGRAAFERATRVCAAVGLRPRRHLAGTAATLADPAARLDTVRPGAGLVGIDPSGSTPLRSAMRLTAPVVAVREVPAGALVGYGSHHRTARSTRLALLPVGYADGLPTRVEGRAEVLLAGRRVPVLGAVSMDQVVVGLDPVDGPLDRAVHVGDVATVLGPGDHGEPTVAEWAGWAETLPHAILTGLGARSRRVWSPDLGAGRR